MKAEALRLGFDLVGVAPAVVPPGYPRFLDWLDGGNAATMNYLPARREARSHPEAILAGVRSVVMVGLVYGEPSPTETTETQGKIARYAQGGDYHAVLWRRLEALLAWLQAESPGTRGRAVADTAPLLERDFARLAGLGWIGKNTMMIHPRLGSFTVLGALLVDLDLTSDAPFAFDRCGTCTRCLDACPTDAFTGPYQLDARRCISYWTIEHKGPIPDDAAESLDGWAFGCDVCQDVCPWNRKARSGHDPALAARDEWVNPDLLSWLDRDPSEWGQHLKDTAQTRSKRRGLVRNAALILGTRRVVAAIPALSRLLSDGDETIRWAAAWALKRIGVGEHAEFEQTGSKRDDRTPMERDSVVETKP